MASHLHRTLAHKSQCMLFVLRPNNCCDKYSENKNRRLLEPRQWSWLVGDEAGRLFIIRQSEVNHLSREIIFLS